MDFLGKKLRRGGIIPPEEIPESLESFPAITPLPVVGDGARASYKVGGLVWYNELGVFFYRNGKISRWSPQRSDRRKAE